MKSSQLWRWCVVGCFAMLSATSVMAEMQQGKPDLKSAGPLTFGREGVLFVGDTASAALFAIDTKDQNTSGNKTVKLEKVDQQITAMLGTTADDILLNDVAVNPESGRVYLSVSLGRGPDATPVILRTKADGGLEVMSLEDVSFDQVAIPNAPAAGGSGRNDKRSQSITDLAFIDGKVIIAGLSNEEFESNLRSVRFPFSDADDGTAVEIYHGAHGAYETRSPVRTFVPFMIDDQPHLLAAYTCTPLVKFPISDLTKGEKVLGTTVAELGNRNRPIDMIVYKKEGKNYLLLANNARGVMKIATDDIQNVEPITDRVDGGGTAGLKYDTIEGMTGVEQLDKLDEKHAIVLVSSEAGKDLQTVELP